MSCVSTSGRGLAWLLAGGLLLGCGGSEAPPAYSSVEAPGRDAPRVHGLIVESGFYLRSTGAVAVDS